MLERSYRDRLGNDAELGSAIRVHTSSGEVLLELGVMRNFESMSADAWAALSPSEAREVARDLIRTADWLERRRG